MEAYKTRRGISSQLREKSFTGDKRMQRQVPLNSHPALSVSQEQIVASKN